MSTPSSCSFAALAASSSLNNAGVHLLQQGRFEEAAKTLKGALTILQIALGADEDQLSLLDKFIQENLRDASIRLSQGYQQQQSKSNNKESSCASFFQIHTVESDDIMRLKSSVSSPLFHADHSAILDRNPSLERLDLSSGILLYNYGLSCYLQACVSGDSIIICKAFQTKQQVLQSVAYKSFFLANAAFSRIFAPEHQENDNTSDQEQEEEGDSMPELQASLCTVIALSATSKVLHSQNRHSQAQETEQAVERMMIFIEEEHKCSLLVAEMSFSLGVATAA